MVPKRTDRRSGEKILDQRSAFERDRDRLLYAGALRRLVGVTQVVSPSEGEIYHNRLTHTLKVAQVARRIAEMFLNKNTKKQLEDWGEIDADVVEAAALAHDLGHPPFGHLAEDELNILASKHIGADGYEGNAQSFRLITRLAVRRVESAHGLDLTRATLNATLKYPRFASADIHKYGAFREDEEAFNFARAMPTNIEDKPCIEAQIMDWADDITYSIHDTEDFYRAGLIPLHLLRASQGERDRFLEGAIQRRIDIKKPFAQPRQELKAVFDDFCFSLPMSEAYTGTRSQRAALALFTSKTVSDFVQGTSLRRHPGLDGDGLEIEAVFHLQVALLKELTWLYVIDNPALAGHQYGQRTIIRTLFKIFYKAAKKRNWVLFPPQFREEAEEVLQRQGDITPARRARLVADTIASMTDQQALRMFHRLTGTSQGSVLDPIVS